MRSIHTHAGEVRVLKLNSETGVWEQRGKAIRGEKYKDYKEGVGKAAAALNVTRSCIRLCYYQVDDLFLDLFV